MNTPLLHANKFNLSLKNSPKQLLNELNFSIYHKEIVAILGESGSGKSLTVQSILGLLSLHIFQTTGSIYFENQDLLHLSAKAMREIRGNKIGWMSQDPSAALNPTLKIQTQLLENLYKKFPHLSKKEAINIGLEWLKRMHVTNPSLRMQQYPHQLSGGLKQRVALAMALIAQPTLLLADEPTTALDMTVQAEILVLFKELVQKNELSILLITHDLGVVANCCDRVIVLHGGQIVETGTVDEIFYHPKSQHTQALLQAKEQLIYGK